MANRVDLEPAYVLHRREYRDTSFLVDAWTLNYGKVALVARGARGSTRRFPSLQPFQRFLMSWSGRGELATLKSCETDGLAYQLTGPLAISGFYLNELLAYLLHKYDPNPHLFELYEQALIKLAYLKPSELDTSYEEQRILRIFEKRLLECLGYGIHFEHDIEAGEEIVATQWYYYDVENGFHIADKQAKNAFLGENLLSYGREELNNQGVLKDAKRLMRMTLDYHLDGKQLKSRELRLAMELEKREH